MKWYVYIVECERDTLYTGITSNLIRRFKEHKQGKGGRFTRSFKVDKMVYWEEHCSKIEALRREAQIKGWTRKKKLALVKGDFQLLENHSRFE